MLSLITTEVIVIWKFRNTTKRLLEAFFNWWGIKSLFVYYAKKKNNNNNIKNKLAWSDFSAIVNCGILFPSLNFVHVIRQLYPNVQLTWLRKMRSNFSIQ